MYHLRELSKPVVICWAQHTLLLANLGTISEMNDGLPINSRVRQDTTTASGT